MVLHMYPLRSGPARPEAMEIHRSQSTLTLNPKPPVGSELPDPPSKIPLNPDLSIPQTLEQRDGPVERQDPPPTARGLGFRV